MEEYSKNKGLNRKINYSINLLQKSRKDGFINGIREDFI